MLTQNRVAIALPRLPEQVQRLGITVKKNSPNLLMVIHLLSPDGSRDQLYMSNYATLHLRDQLARLDGVGDAVIFGGQDYAMRIWLDPDKVAARNLTAGEVVAALQAQNVQVSAGVINQPPITTPGAFQLNVQTLGRLTDPQQFGEVIVKSDGAGHVTRVRDIGRVELGSQAYGANGYLDRYSAVPIIVYQQPGSNALATAERIHAEMESLSKSFPAGLKYDIVYDTTIVVAQSVHEVLTTILEAVGLVVVVVILFLQTWRASVVPIIAIPVSLVGTFTILAALGFSLNNLSLFGLVLAVGIVVDDAIVVVENVERNLRAGMTPREAAHRTMDEVGGALIAIALTLCAVFIPTAFISGISGQFFRQFAVTIAASTVISCLISLTLSPSLCALLFKPHVEGHARRPAWWARPVLAFFNGFNVAFDWLSDRYGRFTARLFRALTAVLVVYAGLIGLTAYQFHRAPTGFIPDQDLGYLITVVALPPGASLARTDAVIRRATEAILATPGVQHAVAFAGFDGATFTNASNAGAIFSPLLPFDERAKTGQTIPFILGEMQKRLGAIQDAFIITIPPPPVAGIGTAGGFKMMLQDQKGVGSIALSHAAQELVGAARTVPGMAQMFSPFSTGTPSVYADIDREKAEKLGVSPDKVFEAMQVYLGSAYINDFNYLGRTYQVTAQADGRFRASVEDIARLKTRNAAGAMVPIGSVAQMHGTTGSLPRAALRPVPRRRGAGRRRAGLPLELRAGDNGAPRRRTPAGRHRLRVDRPRLSAEDGGRHGHSHLRGVRVLRLSRARGAIRELEPAARRGAHRADVPAGRGHGPALPHHERRHPRADRLRRARRPRRQERHPHRRVRQAGAGRRRKRARGGGAGGAHPVPPDPDDVLRLYPRRHSAGDGNRRGLGDAPVSRHHRVLRHARGDPVRPHLHAELLCGDAGAGGPGAPRPRRAARRRWRAGGMSEPDAQVEGPPSRPDKGEVSRPRLTVKRGHLGRYRFTLLTEGGRVTGEIRVEMDGASRTAQDAHARAAIRRLAANLVAAAEADADVS